MKKIEEQRGITLVALVVTIIVLLILAGVSIAMTLNNSGIFSRARNATDKYAEKADEENQILADYSDQLDDYKNKYGVGDTTTVTKANYGWKTNYVASGSESTVWRVFFTDSSNVYLIADNAVETFNYGSYSNTDTTDLTTSLNSGWKNEWNSQNSTRSIEMLTNKGNWTKYLDSNEIASWAIGTPTLDLYAKSYNDTHTDKITYTEGDDGYLPNSITLSLSGYYGIYDSSILLASPRVNPAPGIIANGSLLCLLDNSTSQFSAVDYQSSKSLRPIVAIAKNKFVFEIKDE